jgi:hypothetical protein
LTDVSGYLERERWRRKEKMNGDERRAKEKPC